VLSPRLNRRSMPGSMVRQMLDRTARWQRRLAPAPSPVRPLTQQPARRPEQRSSPRTRSPRQGPPPAQRALAQSRPRLPARLLGPNQLSMPVRATAPQPMPRVWSQMQRLSRRWPMHLAALFPMVDRARSTRLLAAWAMRLLAAWAMRLLAAWAMRLLAAWAMRLGPHKTAVRWPLQTAPESTVRPPPRPDPLAAAVAW
jgi:hypothetical protein